VSNKKVKLNRSKGTEQTKTKWKLSNKQKSRHEKIGGSETKVSRSGATNLDASRFYVYLISKATVALDQETDEKRSSRKKHT